MPYMTPLKTGDPCPLCGQPIKTEDPEELWLLTCIALAIKQNGAYPPGVHADGETHG